MPRLTSALCMLLLLAAWGFDLLTPQALVAAILLTIPVALSGLLLDRRVTAAFVAAALLADVSAGWYNGVQQGHHWDAVAVANRVLAAFSVVLVGVLGALAQGAAERSARLAARQRQTERERSLRRAFEAIRSSVNVELVLRAVVREAVRVFDADAARLYTVEGGRLAAMTFSCERGTQDVAISRERPPEEVLAVAGRTLEEREIGALQPADALSRFALQTLGMDHALIVPMVDHGTSVGVLLVCAASPEHLPHEAAAAARVYGEQASIAVAQARLFVELAEKNEALQAANRSIAHRGEVIREIVYALSHDLRTPVTALRMTLQQALDGVYGSLPGPYSDVLRRTIGSTEELGRLTETLLLVARYESGEQSALRTPVALARIAQSVIEELHPMWASKAVELDVDLDEDATVLGDESELRRAILNLVANAITWTPEGGRIEVRAARGERSVLIEVADTGYGVPEEQRPYLFQRRPPATAGVRGAGSGLGLYIVRRIAESHGGTVGYSPREPRGSRFVLELPGVLAHA